MATLKPFHAQTVLQCWRIARTQARAYQRAANLPGQTRTDRAVCLAKRDAADRIALTIRYGRRRGK